MLFRSYSSAFHAENCEKSHTCKHEPVYSFIDASSDCWWFTVSGIQKYCKICNKDLGRVDFEYIDDDDGQDILAAIYDVVDGVRK